MNNHEYAAVVLAAGLSSRMGDFKPLLLVGGETLIDRAASIFLANQVDVILVTGWRKDELSAGIKTRDIILAENPDYRQGMFTSVKAGIKRLEPSHKAFFILPVDIPLVRPETIQRLLLEAEKCPGQILYPVLGSRRGHPVLIPSSLAPVISNWPADGNLKAVLNSRSDISREVKVPDRFILFDMDTPEDYRALLAGAGKYDIPSKEEIEEIFQSFSTADPDRRRHCEKVAETAVQIGRRLQEAGHTLDLDLVEAAAALHDIAKGRPKHDIAGGEMLRGMGFGRVGEAVGVHSELAGGNTGLSLEARVVYLADKFVQGDRVVTIEDRYSITGRRFAVTPEVEAMILERRRVALQVKQDLESMLGGPLP